MSEDCEQALRLPRARPRPGPEGVSLDPACAFGAVVDERLKELAAKADEIRGRVNALIYAVLTAILLDLAMKLLR